MARDLASALNLALAIAKTDLIVSAFSLHEAGYGVTPVSDLVSIDGDSSDLAVVASAAAKVETGWLVAARECVERRLSGAGHRPDDHEHARIQSARRYPGAFTGLLAAFVFVDLQRSAPEAAVVRL